MIHLITYADEKMTMSRDKCVQSSLKYGVDQAHAFGKDAIDREFAQMNERVLNSDRGAGYWLWKPYFIYRMMLCMQDGDMLVYSDAGVEFIAPVNEIVSRMDEDIFFFTNGFPHIEWCKGNVYEAITGRRIPNDGQYLHLANDKQVQASVIFLKVNQATRDFVKEWLLWCQMPGFIDDSPSKRSNYPTFAEHRHDQAILTCLQIKYGYKLHWWPTQYSEHIRVPGDTYPVIFNHHRKRNNEW